MSKPQTCSINSYPGTIKLKLNRKTHLGVYNHLNSFDWPILGEYMVQFFLGSVHTQAKHSQAPGGFWVVPGTQVASATRHRAM